jgi:hypothetical protein
MSRGAQYLLIFSLYGEWALHPKEVLAACLHRLEGAEVEENIFLFMMEQDGQTILRRLPTMQVVDDIITHLAWVEDLDGNDVIEVGFKLDWGWDTQIPDPAEFEVVTRTRESWLNWLRQQVAAYKS